ncbi:MAG TPA: hypothetical protein VFY22_12090, partial [Hydrogenophaga sp.]|nr:hypothetical protein [Hydrogenophaga sp.]
VSGCGFCGVIRNQKTRRKKTGTEGNLGIEGVYIQALPGDAFRIRDPHRQKHAEYRDQQQWKILTEVFD